MNKFSKAYDIICEKEKANMVAQGLSGIAGFPWTLVVDAGVIPTLYIPLYNQLRLNFARTSDQADRIADLLLEIAPEILSDIVFDKIAGQIPLIGTFFNVLCAKNMTWRLGILFTMLAARGEEIHSEKVRESMTLIRASFPQKNFWRFTRPSLGQFELLCAQFQDIDQAEYNARIDERLREMHIADF